jgi:hypothetical protein
MANHKSVNAVESGDGDARAYYSAQPTQRRAALAKEMAAEVLDHYDHARALVGALVTELRALRGEVAEEAKEALQLATVTEAWLLDGDNFGQRLRLTACLQAMSEASHA